MGRMPWLRMALPVQRLFLAPRNLVCSLPSRSLLNHRPSLSRSGHIQIYSRIAASLDASVPHQHSRSLSTNLETEGRESASTNNEVTADYSAWKRDSSGPEIANKCEAPAVDWLRLSERDLLMHCKLDTFRASGPGGQHRNKTESAVRIRHLPTALVAQVRQFGFLMEHTPFYTLQKCIHTSGFLENFVNAIHADDISQILCDGKHKVKAAR